MPLDKRAAQTLANYGAVRRGWDEAGSMAMLAKVAHVTADDVAMAWVRFCADAKVKTPGAFPNLNGPHWRERVAEAATYRPPRADEMCPTHGGHGGTCPGCRADQLAGDPASSGRPSANAADHLEAIRAEHTRVRSTLCAHGVKPENCADHRPAPKETP